MSGGGGGWCTRNDLSDSHWDIFTSFNMMTTKDFLEDSATWFPLINRKFLALIIFVSD